MLLEELLKIYMGIKFSSTVFTEKLNLGLFHLKGQNDTFIEGNKHFLEV